MEFMGLYEDKTRLFREIKGRDRGRFRNQNFSARGHLESLPDYIVTIEKIRECEKQVSNKCCLSYFLKFEYELRFLKLNYTLYLIPFFYFQIFNSIYFSNIFPHFRISINYVILKIAK